MDLWRFTSKEENTKFSVSIRNRLRQVKRQSSNQKSKFHFLLNSLIISGFGKNKKRRTS